MYFKMQSLHNDNFRSEWNKQQQKWTYSLLHNPRLKPKWLKKAEFDKQQRVRDKKQKKQLANDL